MNTLSSQISAGLFVAVISGIASLVIAWLNLKNGRLLCLVSQTPASPGETDSASTPHPDAQPALPVRIEIVNIGMADIRQADIQSHIQLSLSNGLCFVGPAVLTAKTPGMNCHVHKTERGFEIDPGPLFKSRDCIRVEVPVTSDEGMKSAVKALQGTARIYNTRLWIHALPKKWEIALLLVLAGIFLLMLLALAFALGNSPLFYILCLALAPLCTQLIIILIWACWAYWAKRAMVPSI